MSKFNRFPRKISIFQHDMINKSLHVVTGTQRCQTPLCPCIGCTWIRLFPFSCSYIFIFFLDPQFFLFNVIHLLQRCHKTYNQLSIKHLSFKNICNTSVTHLSHIAIRASLTACSAEFAIRQNPAIWITSLYHAIRNPYWKLNVPYRKLIVPSMLQTK